MKMGHLGVSQIYSDEKNMAIILTRYAENPELTRKQVHFLIVCWKGRHRLRARQYFQQLKEFMRLPREEQQKRIEEAKQFLKREYTELKVVM